VRADLPGCSIEAIAAEARQWLIAGGRVRRAVGQGQKVDGHLSAVALDARRAVRLPDDRCEDGVAGRVLRVDDAPGLMPSLARQVEVAAWIPVERDAEVIDEKRPHGRRSLRHELL